jgi:hypothetical protein
MLELANQNLVYTSEISVTENDGPRLDKSRREVFEEVCFLELV